MRRLSTLATTRSRRQGQLPRPHQALLLSRSLGYQTSTHAPFTPGYSMPDNLSFSALAMMLACLFGCLVEASYANVLLQ